MMPWSCCLNLIECIDFKSLCNGYSYVAHVKHMQNMHLYFSDCIGMEETLANLTIHYKFARFICQLLVTSEIAIEAGLNFAKVYCNLPNFLPQQSFPLYSSKVTNIRIV